MLKFKLDKKQLLKLIETKRDFKVEASSTLLKWILKKELTLLSDKGKD